MHAPSPVKVHGPGEAQRIAKVMARAGACSRRDAEAWIAEGRVAVNGKVLRDPAFNVGESDLVTIDGEPLPRRARTRLFRFHKPRGLVATEHDPEGRPTIFDYLREHWPEGPRIVSVGRLDINTEGLILVTNDGGLARVLELPSTGWVRRYRVRVNGETDQAALDALRRGITIDGISYAAIEASLDRVQGANCWLTMALREGKNREIKRVLEHLGLTVNRLIRISFGPFQLGELAEGAIEEVRTKVLRDQLGPSLATAAGADFTSPAEEAPEPAPAVPQPARHRADHRPSQGRTRPRQNLASSRERPQPRDKRDKSPGEVSPPRIGRRTGMGLAPKAAPGAAVKPPPRIRKHVSVLRQQETSAPSGPRKRIERAEAHDRSGRVVAVERVVPVGAKPERAATRNGRRFESLRKGPNEGREHSSAKKKFAKAGGAEGRAPSRAGKPRVEKKWADPGQGQAQMQQKRSGRPAPRTAQAPKKDRPGSRRRDTR
jgi:23S rRNA pseudouridine2605 synthase